MKELHLPFHKLIKLFVIILTFSVALVTASNSDLVEKLFTKKLYIYVEKSYGKDSVDIIEQWKQVIIDDLDSSDWNKLNAANQFFNKNVAYKTDQNHWKQEDYWATPVESLGTGAGDCEDFAIAKYFTLKAMGVDTSKLRLMYVRALKWDEAHMVLIYNESPNAVPLVLDNIDKRIKPASKRRDLKPIYSFNAEGLWLARGKGLGKKVKNNKGIAKWTEVMSRIENEK